MTAIARLDPRPNCACCCASRSCSRSGLRVPARPARRHGRSRLQRPGRRPRRAAASSRPTCRSLIAFNLAMLGISVLPDGARDLPRARRPRRLAHHAGAARRAARARSSAMNAVDRRRRRGARPRRGRTRLRRVAAPAGARLRARVRARPGPRCSPSGCCIAARRADRARIANAIGTLLFFPLMFFAGLWIPRAAMADTLRADQRLTPLGRGRGGAAGRDGGHVARSRAAARAGRLTRWSGSLLATRLFRWE